jgi:hypothetical protein
MFMATSDRTPSLPTPKEMAARRAQDTADNQKRLAQFAAREAGWQARSEKRKADHLARFEAAQVALAAAHPTDVAHSG